MSKKTVIIYHYYNAIQVHPDRCETIEYDGHLTKEEIDEQFRLDVPDKEIDMRQTMLYSRVPKIQCIQYKD